MGFLNNKRALIVGVASDRSIAWGIAQAMKREGAEIALSYPNDKLRPRVEGFAAELGSDFVMPLDVTKDDQIDAAFAAIEQRWGHLDIIVHSVAFAPSEELKGSYVDNVTRAGFAMAQDISSYSFVALAKAGRRLMKGRNAAMLTLSYLGAERALPSYNVMSPAKASLEGNVRQMAFDLGPDGIRVNAISAGPIRTLAASGIGNFRKMLEFNAKAAPLRRNVTIEEVGNSAAFLCSDLASGITGEVLHVDGGFHIVGLSGVEFD
jgi:Enoyl-[acyl-carrier-protein] reductase (NADH)